MDAKVEHVPTNSCLHISQIESTMQNMDVGQMFRCWPPARKSSVQWFLVYHLISISRISSCFSFKFNWVLVNIVQFQLCKSLTKCKEMNQMCVSRSNCHTCTQLYCLMVANTTMRLQMSTQCLFVIFPIYFEKWSDRQVPWCTSGKRNRCYLSFPMFTSDST